MIWDLVIVTARSASQRWLFERYLGRLWPGPGAPNAPRYAVVQDPPGPQLGTAGATVHALCTAAQLLGERLPAARIVVLHCGGLSQRVPQLSHLGKAFAPGAPPADETTLFAQIVAALNRLFQEMEPGVVIACGDVLYTAPAVGRPYRQGEAVAIAYPAPAEQAVRHGVYLWQDGQDHVSEAWQKPPLARLEELGAGQPWGLDTGILYFGARVVEELLRATGVTVSAEASAAFLRRKREWRGVELYRDLTPPMTPSWNDTQRLPGAPGAAQRALSRFPLLLACPEPAELRHFGTTQELLRILSESKGARLFSSYVAAGSLAPGAVLDRCLSEVPIQVGAGSYISGLRRSGSELAIGAGRVAYQVPLRARQSASSCRTELFVTVGVSDNAKQHPDDGATLLGQPLDQWLYELGVSRETVWEGIPDRERSLWNARLFPVGEGEAAADAVPWLEDGGDRELGLRVDRWHRGTRASMAEASQRFDVRRWWAHEQRIQARCLAAAIEAAVRRGDGLRVGELLRASAVSKQGQVLVSRRLRALAIAEPNSLIGARAWLAASALPLPTAVHLRERGLITLSRALVRERVTAEPKLVWRLAPGEGVKARAPARVDLAGGWTDTPPQACERGGAVLNLALRLEGALPISARVERLIEPVVELVAADLGCHRRLVASSSLARRLDPQDPFGIHLAGLRLVGLLGPGSLSGRLRQLGGGIRVTTAARVPKGSGLGTSSILGAALLAALSEAFSLQRSREEMCREVLQLEQLMGTGGGWQDQVGGMWGGVKLARSAPGLDQRPQVEPLHLSPEVEQGLAARMVLFYTGEPRLARDLLQRVVSRYLVGDAEVIAALDEMPSLAEQTRVALRQGDWPALGRCLTRSWELNQQLEPTCSNPRLAALLERIEPFVTGAKLAGAGGGGFLFAIARDAGARERLEALLASIPPPARLYSATLAQEGMIVRSVTSSLEPNT